MSQQLIAHLTPMRHHPGFLAAVLLASLVTAFASPSCGAGAIDAGKPAAARTAATARPTGILAFAIVPVARTKTQSVPDLTVEFQGESRTFPMTTVTEFAIPASKRELFNFHINGAPFWAMVHPGERITVREDPCCGIQVVNDAFYDDRFAIRPVNTAGQACGTQTTDTEANCACPAGTSKLVPGLARDTFGRCIRNPKVRIINTSGIPVRIPNPYDPDLQPPTLTAATSPGEARYQDTDGYLNTAHTLKLTIQFMPEKTTQTHTTAPLEFLTLSPSSRYTVWISRNGISRVTHDGRL